MLAFLFFVWFLNTLRVEGGKKTLKKNVPGSQEKGGVEVEKGNKCKIVGVVGK